MNYEEKHEEACGVGDVFWRLKIDSGTRVVVVLGCFGFEKLRFLGIFFVFLRFFTHFFIKMMRNWLMFFGYTRI